jgi:hypothetical protein
MIVSSKKKGEKDDEKEKFGHFGINDMCGRILAWDLFSGGGVSNKGEPPCPAFQHSR